VINFSATPRHTFLGRLLRLPLRCVPASWPVPIVQGPLRGKRWIVGSGDHGYWLGSYELDKQRLMQSRVRAGQVVFDVGAHAGYYSMLASALVGNAGRVVAFEPLPANLDRIDRHLRLNRIGNVTVVRAAVTDRRGTARFEAGPSSAMGHLAERGEVSVPTLSLDGAVFQDGLPAPHHIKLDCEGAEFLALSGARRLLADFRPVLYLSTDTGETHRQCCTLLESLRYRLEPVGAANLDQAYEILAEPAP